MKEEIELLVVCSIDCKRWFKAHARSRPSSSDLINSLTLFLSVGTHFIQHIFYNA